MIQISLHSSIKTIGHNAFEECLSLRKISLICWVNGIELGLNYNVKLEIIK